MTKPTHEPKSKSTANRRRREQELALYDTQANTGLETIVVDANQLYEFLALGVVTPPRHRSWRRWRTFLSEDGGWRGLGSAGAVVPAVKGNGRPVVLAFETLPPDASGVLPVSRLKTVSVSSPEEMHELTTRLRKDDFFPTTVEVTVDSELTIERIEEASTPEVDAELSHRLEQADRVVGGLAGLLAMFDGSKEVLQIFTPLVADNEGAWPRGSAADAMIFGEGLGGLLGLSGAETIALLGAMQAHYVDGALDRSASLPAICDSLAGRSNLAKWRSLIQEILAGNIEAKASMVADPDAEGEDLLLRVLALILVRLPSQMTVDELVGAASNLSFPIGRRVACVAAGIVGWCQGLEAQRTVKQGMFGEFLCRLLADGLAVNPRIWSRSILSQSESRYEQTLVLSESGVVLVSAKTEVPLVWERPIAQIRDWAARHSDRHPDEIVRFRFDQMCVEVSTDRAHHTIELRDYERDLKEISISASVPLATKKPLQLKHWKELNELQLASRCRIAVDHRADTFVFTVSQVRETWDQHEVDWAFEVIADAISALWRSENLSPELKRRSSE